MDAALIQSGLCYYAGLYAENLQRWGELGGFKKEGAQLQAVSGGALEDNVSLIILRGARLTQGGQMLPPPPPK